MTQYFTRDTDKAIAGFLASADKEERHRLFQEEIRPAFEKLIENLIFVYSFFKIDDVETLKRECLTHLYEMIPKYNPDRGTKGFSYFNVVAKNWFIARTREKNKRNKLESELFYDLDHEVVRSDPSFMISPHEALLEEREMWAKFYEELDSWRDVLTKKSERQVLEAVIILMKNSDCVSIYNKKAVYLYLRELTGLNTKQVVINLKKIKSLYARWRDEYCTSGENSVDREGED